MSTRLTCPSIPRDSSGPLRQAILIHGNIMKYQSLPVFAKNIYPPTPRVSGRRVRALSDAMPPRRAIQHFLCHPPSLATWHFPVSLSIPCFARFSSGPRSRNFGVEPEPCPGRFPVSSPFQYAILENTNQTTRHWHNPCSFPFSMPY